MIFAEKNPNFVWLYAHLVYCLYRFLIVKALEGMFNKNMALVLALYGIVKITVLIISLYPHNC